MVAQVIDGRAAARRLKEHLAGEVAGLRATGAPLGLATVLVGGDLGAAAYERRLRLLAGELGVAYRPRVLPGGFGRGELLDVVAELNADPAVSGILVLRPLPAPIDEV
jgi:methylenetetrahydrofolate dehydrogenase (NADP+)/methenyltetrahydrofolate cyclohydrolase